MFLVFILVPHELHYSLNSILNLDSNEQAALKVDEAILKNKPDSWRGNMIKERSVKLAIRRALAECGVDDEDTIGRIMELVRNQNEY